MDNEEFIRREREHDARKREAFLKQQEKNDIKFESSGATHQGASMIKGEIGPSLRSRLSGFGSKFKEALPRAPTDEEIEEKITKTTRKARLTEAEARLAKAKKSKSAAGGGFWSGLTQPAPAQTSRKRARSQASAPMGDDFSGYLSMFEQSPQPTGKRRRAAAPADGYDMSGYLSGWSPESMFGGAAPRKSKKQSHSRDPIGQYFY